MQLQWEYIKRQLREMGFSSMTVDAAVAAYEAEHEAESRSHLNWDPSMRQSRGGMATEGGAASQAAAETTVGADGVVRELTREEKESIRQKMKFLKLEGRLLPDSAMTTYFGKPAFHAYGNGNVRPASGGLVYG